MQNDLLMTPPIVDFMGTLEEAHKESTQAFIDTYLTLDDAHKAALLLEMPEVYQREILLALGAKKLAKIINELRTDDATDMMILLKALDEAKWLDTLALLDHAVTTAVKSLMDYGEDEAGALMEIELFTVSKSEPIFASLKRLRKLVDQGSMRHISNIYLVDKEHRLLAIFPLAKVATADQTLTYGMLYNKHDAPITVHSRASLSEAARLMTRYDLQVLPVINQHGRLLGRITHDDILDYLQEDATRQMYGLGQVDPGEEIQEGVLRSGRDRAIWLAINLINVTFVSMVIGLFEHSLQQVVALAVLMPIVANMAGSASMQTLTVVVRQMALGNLRWGEAAPVMVKEVKIALFNGTIFAIAAGILAQLRFDSLPISEVMAASMFVTFLLAGGLSAFVPLWLKVFKIDPAVASSVIVITLVDVIGFFSFLGFATLWIPDIIAS
jgi:magnesium transporter